MPNRAGIDNRNESERRYGEMPKDSTLEHRHGGRESEYQGRKINRPKRKSKVEADAEAKDIGGKMGGSD